METKGIMTHYVAALQIVWFIVLLSSMRIKLQTTADNAVVSRNIKNTGFCGLSLIVKEDIRGALERPQGATLALCKLTQRNVVEYDERGDVEGCPQTCETVIVHIAEDRNMGYPKPKIGTISIQIDRLPRRRHNVPVWCRAWQMRVNGRYSLVAGSSW